MIRKDLVLVTLLIVILTLMVVPLSQAIIDVLIAVNMSLAVLLLMVAIYLKHPSDFSTFPSVILLGTAFRLALSIGTTRLILSEADAGKIIETFGDFVVGGSIAIGLVIFLIITVVQFLVVTKGAERVAEVGARFALDAMPGKQMAIDADVRAGTLDQEEAARRRKRLDKDSQFFGAMDGAMKFVKGDAIAGLVIIVINLIGGIAVGVTLHELSFSGAVAVYSLLTIGDGLVAQIPALLMSLCAGVIVTRVANNDNDDLGSDISRELISDQRVPAVAAIVVFGMGLIPGFPFAVFASSAALLLIMSHFLRRSMRLKFEAEERDSEAQKEAKVEEDNAKVQQARSRQRFRVLLGPELAARLSIEELTAHIGANFNHLRAVRGVEFPTPNVFVETTTKKNEMVIELDEVPIQRRSIPLDFNLVAGGAEIAPLLEAKVEEYMDAEWPETEAFWIKSDLEDRVKEIGLEILPLEQKLAELIFRVYEQNLGVLFSKGEFDALAALSLKIDPNAWQEHEAKLTKPVLFQVLRYLVEDGVPLRPIQLLLDSLGYWLQANPNAGPVLLAECMRGSLKRQLCHMIAGKENILGVAMIDPNLEKLARRGLTEAKRIGNLDTLEGLIFETPVTEKLVGKFLRLQQAQRANENQLVIIASTDLRRRLRNFLSANNIHLPVLAPHELSPDVKTYPIELITLGAALSTRLEPRETLSKKRA
ncbi:MAG: FHIPEP family type III secretion protein [Pseudomonadota bacterium]